MIDALAVHKDVDGEIEVQHLSTLKKDEAIEVGSTVGALVGLGIEGEEGGRQAPSSAPRRAEDGVKVIHRRTGLGCPRGDPE